MTLMPRVYLSVRLNVSKSAACIALEGARRGENAPRVRLNHPARVSRLADTGGLVLGVAISTSHGSSRSCKGKSRHAHDDFHGP